MRITTCSIEVYIVIISVLLGHSLITAQRIFNAKTQINNVIVHNEKVFVGAVNELHVLSLDSLTSKHRIETGPVRDSPQCSPDGKSCLRDARPELTNNANKILQITPEGLLQCGSTKQGTCFIHSLDDLSLRSSGLVPVAANSENASTVALRLSASRLLVAASHSVDSPYREIFPTLAFRDLPDLFVTNSGNLDGEAAVFIRSEYRSSFRVRYITAFEHEHFVYVAVVQPEDIRRNSALVTKLVRICRNDTRFSSYSEIELQCRNDENFVFPVLTSAKLRENELIAAFASNDTFSAEASLCVFSMQRIKLTFWYNIDRCRGGTDSVGMPHIGRDAQCINKSRIALDEDTCELGVGGSIEAVEIAAIGLENVVTSLETIVEPPVIVAGNNNGQVIMMKEQSASQLEEYSRKDVGEPNSVVSSVQIIGEDILVVLPKQILLYPLSTCAQSTSCSECLLSKDPLCGWCHSTSKCTTNAQCPTQNVALCPASDGQPTPKRFALDDRTPIHIRFRHLPRPRGYSYECVFGDAMSIGVWSEEGVSCRPPPLRLSAPQRDVLLSIRTNSSSLPISSHNVTVFNCNAHSICSSCISMPECSWCSGSCTRSSQCKSAASTECVRFGRKDLLLPIGTSSVRIPLLNFDHVGKSAPLSCSVSIDGKAMSTPAEIRDGNLECGEMALKYRSAVANVTTTLNFTQGTEVVDSIALTLYRCSFLASDCSSCLTLPEIYSCGWCGGRCTSDCPNKEKQNLETVCDKPRITDFSPTSGPIAGGTLLTIRGRDLGSTIEDVADRVWVAGTKCIVVDYEISKRIVCRLGKGHSSGPIRVAVGRAAQRTAESSKFFSFVDVSLQSIFPLFGPISGGTRVSLYGQNLNAGSNATVLIGNVPCKVEEPRNSSSSLRCITSSAANAVRTTRVLLSIDRSSIPLETTFHFRPDPTIRSIHPLNVFRSGGRTLHVEGTNFDSVQSAQLYLLLSQHSPLEVVSNGTSKCHINNSTSMSCESPALLNNKNTQGNYLRYAVGFAMDDVRSVRNLAPRIVLTVSQDPQFAPFKGVRLHQGEQPLILDGMFLNEAAEPADYKIFIGSERCYVTLVDAKQIVCSAPSKQPQPSDEQGNQINGGLPLVTAIIGNVRMELGLLEYADGISTIRLSVLMGVVAAVVLFVVVFLLFLWRRRRSERERDYKKIQLQMEHLESNVRKECKQAFVELQTSMSTNGADDEHVDFVSFREFVHRLLWLDQTLPMSPSFYAATMPVTLAQFDALLSSKHFVFALVETAESDVTLPPSERSLLASLLVSVLSRNFHYLSEVVIELLRAHIARSVHNKSAELLFRKSDSVVEKLVSKWLTICLHEHLQENQAVKFFSLYQALKLQTEKGPVDMLSGKARYTINEGNLLRETVDTAVLDCLVMNLEGCGPFKVHANACDTISQVKAKTLDVVYKGVPFSQRPHLEHFELEWQCPRKGNVSLTDDDKPQGTMKAPRKLNTVAHYGISTGALLCMVPSHKTTTISRHRNSLVDSGQSSWSSLERSSPTYSPSAYFHLIPSTRTMDKKKRIDESIPKSIPEVFLTRLLTSKGTVQKYIDDFLESVVYLEDASYPLLLKYVFDLLDEEANRNGVTDHRIVQQWKSNLFVLRVWVNLVKNPRILYDVADSNSVDGNMSVVAQTMIDCFALSDPILGANSPSSRLLFARDISRIRPLSADLFKRIKRQLKVTEEMLHEELSLIASDLSQASGATIALSELLTWVRGNGIRLLELLSSDQACVSQRLPQRLSQVLNLSLDNTENIYCTIPEYASSNPSATLDHRV